MSFRTLSLGIALLAAISIVHTTPASSQPLSLGTAAGPVCRSVPTHEGAGQTGRCVLKETNGPKSSYLTQADKDTDLLYEWFGIHGDEECIPRWVLAEIPEGYELSEGCQICPEK